MYFNVFWETVNSINAPVLAYFFLIMALLIPGDVYRCIAMDHYSPAQREDLSELSRFVVSARSSTGARGISSTGEERPPDTERSGRASRRVGRPPAS